MGSITNLGTVVGPGVRGGVVPSGVGSTISGSSSVSIVVGPKVGGSTCTFGFSVVGPGVVVGTMLGFEVRSLAVVGGTVVEIVGMVVGMGVGVLVGVVGVGMVVVGEGLVVVGMLVGMVSVGTGVVVGMVVGVGVVGVRTVVVGMLVGMVSVRTGVVVGMVVGVGVVGVGVVGVGMVVVGVRTVVVGILVGHAVGMLVRVRVGTGVRAGIIEGRGVTLYGRGGAM